MKLVMKRNLLTRMCVLVHACVRNRKITFVSPSVLPCVQNFVEKDLNRSFGTLGDIWCTNKIIFS